MKKKEERDLPEAGAGVREASMENGQDGWKSSTPCNQGRMAEM